MIDTDTNPWIWTAHKQLMDTPPLIPAHYITSRPRPYTPAGVYLYTEPDGTHAYVGKGDRPRRRMLAHALKLDYGVYSPDYGFRPAYQAVLQRRGVAASTDDTMRAIQQMHFRCVELTDPKHRLLFEKFMIGLLKPLCNHESKDLAHR